MPEHMNPVYPASRGCFIDIYSKKDEGKVVFVDYPTWHLKNGKWIPNSNPSIPEGQPYYKEFNSIEEAQKFAEDENYLVCQLPKSLDPNRKNEKTLYVPDESDDSEYTA